MASFLFLTGTDTGVGKTFVGCRLARRWREAGLHFTVRKPTESGCPEVLGRPVPEDARRLKEASGSPEPLEAICPFPFRAPLAPPQAARLEGRTLLLSQLVEACRKSGAERVVVEGAGGFLSPIAEDGLNADLAVALGAKVLLVASDRLGAIHQILATLEAIERRKLEPLGVVLNPKEKKDPLLDNRSELARWTGVPILGLEEIERWAIW